MIMDIIYGNCGINFEEVPEGSQIDNNKVIVRPEIEEKIIAKIREEYPDLTRLEILLFLLQYGPMTDVDQKEDVILEEGYITKNGRSVKNDKHSEV
ncbi:MULTISPECIES: hypothetical protein [Halanaerobium]|jgi:hypothetical protein|uniref:Uncharacterized protein n=2 Tax=Halanaerobium TaxID=2330 RepID=A0A1G6QIK5_9FIRM|nr:MULTISPECIES: hypothetical protein [Halanaerobium]TDP89648.1 hypothetical protein C7957_1239 [Halanaerobium saccharolyticum]SDC91754.1 hypothetical protein SAMN04488597_11827 [Halanaerobium congolense]